MAIVGSEDLLRKISSQIETQFPAFIREEGANFIAFMKAYYEYMEQSGNAGDAIRSIEDIHDIDRTVDSFVEFFRREFMIHIPKNVLADKRLLTKHIRDFYRSRGSQESYRFLFRALYNKEIDFYYPGDDILRASDGRWIQEIRLRVGSPANIDPRTLEGRRVRGVSSGAVAFVEDIIATEALGLLVYDMTVREVVGSFVDGERIVSVDNPDQFTTVNSQVGPIIDIDIVDGGAFHNLGDSVEISGGGSIESALGVITEVTNKSAVTLKIAKAGSGYTKENTRLLVSGDHGVGFQAKIASYTQESILGGLAINTDIIGPMRNVRLNTPSFFVRSGANTSTIASKLTGTFTTSSGSNTVTGSGTKFQTELKIGDIVRVFGVSNTARVHLVLSNTSFISAIRPTASVSGANGYIGLAGANVNSTLSSALLFSNSAFYSINAITIINPGRGYSTTLPTITIVDETVRRLNLSDGYGNVYGNNAVIIANNAPGTIKKIRITSSGSNFNKYENTLIFNRTQSNAVITETQSSSFSNTSPSSRYLIRKRTISAEGLAKPSGFVTFPGRYIDTKGFLSWNNRLQDNYYYQEFSYVIRVEQLLSKYRDIIKSVLHPAGTKMFGEYTINSSANVNITVIDEAPNVNRATIREVLGLVATHPIAIDYRFGVDVTESITASDSQSAIITTNRSSSESATAAETQSATMVTSRSVSESVTASETESAVYTAATSITESRTSTETQSVIITTNRSATESTTATETQSAVYTAAPSITESRTSTETQSATMITSLSSVESVTASETEAATMITSRSASESTSATETQSATIDAVGSTTESRTSTETQSAIITTTLSSSENITATDAHQGQRFVLMSGVFAAIQYANNQIQQYQSSQIQPYAFITVGSFDGKPRLVTSGSVGATFANGALRANTGMIQVGGRGTNVYIITNPGTPDSTSVVYNVNAIFSNTAFTIRTDYIPITANARIWFSTGP